MIGTSNHPNVLSNNLDQAPKNTETHYQARLDAMSQEIEKAFLKFNTIIEGDDALIDRLSKNEKHLPLHKIYKLQAWKTLSIELKREKSEEKSWEWHQAPSMPKAIKSTQYGQCSFRLSQYEGKSLGAGEKSLVLIIKKESNSRFPKNQDFRISAVEFSIPWTNTLLPQGTVFEKELTGKAFENAVATVQLSK